MPNRKERREIERAKKKQQVLLSSELKKEEDIKKFTYSTDGADMLTNIDTAYVTMSVAMDYIEKADDVRKKFGFDKQWTKEINKLSAQFDRVHKMLTQNYVSDDHETFSYNYELMSNAIHKITDEYVRIQRSLVEKQIDSDTEKK